MRQPARALAGLTSSSSSSKLLEAGQRGIPEGVDELAYAGEALHANRVDVAGTLLPGLHNPCILKQAQVARTRRSAHRKCCCDCANRERAGAQLMQYGAPHRVSEGIECMHHASTTGCHPSCFVRPRLPSND